VSDNNHASGHKIPFFGAKKVAVQALSDLANTKNELDIAKLEIEKLNSECNSVREQINELGLSSFFEVQQKIENEKRYFQALTLKF